MKFFFGLSFLCFLSGCPAPEEHELPDAQEQSPQEPFFDVHCFVPSNGKPTIVGVEYGGAKVRNPHTLRFWLRWEDEDNDLHEGSLLIFLDGVPLPSISLPTISFPKKERGRTYFSINVPKKVPVKVGDMHTIEFVFVDGAGLRSNRPRIGIRAFR